MVAGSGKTSRHEFTDVERQLCLNSLLGERRAQRMRKAEAKDTQAAVEDKDAMQEKAAEAKTTNEPTVQPEATVACEMMADMVMAVALTATPVERIASNGTVVAVEHAVAAPTQQFSKSRSRRRAVLQDTGSDNSSGDDAAVGVEGFLISLPCIVDGDANVMDRDAEQCTYLNSGEDVEVREKHEDDDEDDYIKEKWEEDWKIGDLMEEDRSDDGSVNLPDSGCNSVAQSKKTMATMKMLGWEYDKLFTYTIIWPKSKLCQLPSDSVMAVGNDPLALLFYFMPPKLWMHIASESNRYHTSGEPERKSKIYEIFGVVFRGIQIYYATLHLTARMLQPIRKGIAARRSTKQVGALDLVCS
ncbi:Pleiotropic drug resistance protein transporter [Phytophthora megakarya]|uniref:Pleiotropic drug resistance protein transporter n=1 Tax=Phytophthora megakarya TaxID=4795 RepID=A0A225UU30_9STRA|nr:Pleiotropic drug resistance protein transporter [Phytophthora megakarya]